MFPHSHFHHPKKLHFIKNLVLIIITFLFLSPLPQNLEAMRVHPIKRNITIRDGPNYNSSRMEGNAPKKLRKLPHVFGKVLELPLRSDADVAVEEGPEFFRFTVEIQVDDAARGEVRAQAVEIHPGVIKIVVREDENPNDDADAADVELSLARLDVDKWRYRLPSSTRPELATAVFVDGELIVTVPKGATRRDFADGRHIWGSGTRLVLVQ